MTIHLRKARYQDAKAIWALRKQAIRAQCVGFYAADLLEAWTRGLVTEGFTQTIENFHVITIDHAIVCSGMLDLESGKIEALFVVPEYFGNGYGRQMITHLERLAQQAGFAEVWLEATLNAVNFYRRCGFRGEDISTYHSPRGLALDCVVMRKTLECN